MIDLITFAVAYFIIGILICAILFGDSLGAFPLWISPVMVIWPVIVVVLIAEKAIFLIKTRDKTT